MTKPLIFQPKQEKFHQRLVNSRASWQGFGGSRGGAKSGGLRRSAIRILIDNPGVRGQIIRRVWKDVKVNHVDPFFEDFPELREYYNVQDHELRLPNGSKLNFDAYETAHDVDRAAYGPEYFFKFIDQAEQFSERELMQLKTTCRWPGTPDYKCKFGLFFNPGGIGAAFLRRIFHTHEYHEKEIAGDYEFLQAYAWDNVEWSRAALIEDGIEKHIGSGIPDLDYYQWSSEKRFKYFITRTQYGKELNALPEAMRMGQLLGEFTRFAGQYFTNFDPSRSVKKLVLRPWHKRWISIDWGYDHPSAVYWHAAIDGNHVHTYRELVERELTPKLLGERIALRTGAERISAIVISPDAKARRDSPETIYLQLNKIFRQHNLQSCIPADNDRIGGWMLMYAMLDTDCWTIEPDCVKLIESLPMLLRDPDRDGDCLKVDGDDPADSARYGLKYHLGHSETPQEVIDRETAQKIEDPYARHFFVAKRYNTRDTSPVFRPRYKELWETEK